MTKPYKCLIWGTSADYASTTFDGYDIFSPRAGGRYKVSRTAATVIENKYRNDLNFKTNISLAIFESQGLDDPILLNTELVGEIAHRPSIKPLEKAERLMRHIYRGSPALDVAALCWGNKTNPEELDIALAASGLVHSGELNSVLEYLVRKGFCETKIDNAKGEGWVWLTLEGAQHVADSSTPPINSDQAFVAMWFSSETQEAYELGIRPAITSYGYNAVRIDQKEHNNRIDDEIISEIRKCRFLIADFTCGTALDGDKSISVARGGVYFEAGFAMGLGIPIIWSCREDLIGQVHFDTRQYNHVLWTDADDLLTKLRNRIGAVIGPFSS